MTAKYLLHFVKQLLYILYEHTKIYSSANKDACATNINFSAVILWKVLVCSLMPQNLHADPR
jgi:hypothetical protein